MLKIDVFLSDVFQIGFFIDFGALRDPPGPEKTSKTIVALHENKVPQNPEKRAPGNHFSSILEVLVLLGLICVVFSVLFTDLEF